MPGTPSPLALRGARRPRWPGTRPRGTTTIMPPRNSAMPALTSPGPAFWRHSVNTGATRSKTPDHDHHRTSNRSLPGSLDNRLLTLVRDGSCSIGNHRPRPSDLAVLCRSDRRLPWAPVEGSWWRSACAGHLGPRPFTSPYARRAGRFDARRKAAGSLPGVSWDRPGGRRSPRQTSIRATDHHGLAAACRPAVWQAGRATPEPACCLP